MNDPSTELPDANGAITVAAIGDLHVTENGARRYRELFAEISDAADVLVLAGDLTDFGKPGEAELLAEDLRACTVPAVGVLGNHDYECGCPDKVTEILTQAGVTILDQQACVIEGVGFAGVKGFIGGFGRAELDPFQLRTLRTERVMAVLHYAPIPETIEGEPLEIFPFLGSSRLAQAVDRFDTVKAVVHGHAHRGRYSGATPGGVPVYNVAQFVVKAELGRAYALLQV
jgi:Icc-related predicted phosphoesterase